MRYLMIVFTLIALTVVVVFVHSEEGSAAPVGGYLEFIGPNAGYMEVPDHPVLNPTLQITIEAWVLLDSYTSGYGDQTDCPVIVGKNWTVSYMLSLVCGGDYVEAYINGVQVFEEQHRIPLGEWTHVAVTYDGVTVTTYVNGMVSASQTVGGPLGDTTDPLRIGSDIGWDRTPNGRIDDVRIWNIARTQQQIVAGINEVSTNSQGLVARWTFSSGSLLDLVDGRTGTLVGDAVVVVPTPTPSPSPTPTATPRPTIAPTPSGTPVPVGAKGDINCDQRIDMADTVALLQDLANTKDAPPHCSAPVTPTPTPCPTVSPTNCDVPPTPSPTPDPELPARLNLNCDSAVDSRDGLVLLSHIAGADPGLTGGCEPIGGAEASPTPALSPTTTPTPTPN